MNNTPETNTSKDTNVLAQSILEVSTNNIVEEETTMEPLKSSNRTVKKETTIEPLESSNNTVAEETTIEPLESTDYTDDEETTIEYFEFPDDTKTPDTVDTMDAIKQPKFTPFLYQFSVVCFMTMYMLGNELIFSYTYNTGMNPYKILFAIAGGILLLCVGNLFKNRILSFVLQLILCLFVSIIYITQHIYYCIFSTPYILNSLHGTGDALEFVNVAMDAAKEQWLPCLLYVGLVILLLTLYRSLFFKCTYYPKSKFILIPITCLFLVLSVALPTNLTSGIGSPRYLLLNEYIPISSAKTFGIPVSMALNLTYSIIDPLPYISVSTNVDTEDTTEKEDEEPDSTPDEDIAQDTEEPTTVPETEVVIYGPQKMDIDFNLSEENSTYLEMNYFFANETPDFENEYTGMFEGMNLILITAEGFSDKLIDPELTPTLYKMYSEGFNFENFYTPIWGVSTSDGEFVATTGLLPKSGVWSYTEIADNSMPFAFGNQFNTLGYNSYAFHNHSYTYYNRDLSYPNMGYDYYAKGHGLDVTDVWPESDLEMIELATPMFVEDDQFHVYFLTVSGHLEYSFIGNTMANRNQDAVADLDYSEAVRAYYACNLELEYALTSLIEQLEEAGQLENTVIALSADHYPYGLSTAEYAELYGQETIDKTFELYENGFILWNSEMEESVTIDKYCSSLDIAPTLSNLFNLEYDSRLYIGSDILSSSDGLVMFLDRSYITDDYMYNSSTGEITYLTDVELSNEEIEATSQKVAQYFRYSSMIIEYDYYDYLNITTE